MNIAGHLSVLGHSMLTAVGANGMTTCAAMRAGISGASEAPFWDFTLGESLHAARPRLHQWWEGPTMIPELLAPVIKQCAQQAEELSLVPPSNGRLTLPVLIVLSPADRPLRSPGLDASVMKTLSHHFGGGLPPGSRAIAGGRTGLLPALGIASELIQHSGVPACIVVGAESFLRKSMVEHYIHRGRMLCGTNSNGFVAGEAACGVIVGPRGAGNSDELFIAGVGQGFEASLDGGNAQAPVRGEGLTHATRQALAQASIEFHDLNFSISDHNGERFKFKEAALMAGKLDRMPADGHSRRPRGFMESWHPAESIGEVGAAIFPCLLGWAFEAGAKAYAPGRHALLHAGEDNGDRVVLVTLFERRS